MHDLSSGSETAKHRRRNGQCVFFAQKWMADKFDCYTQVLQLVGIEATEMFVNKLGQGPTSKA